MASSDPRSWLDKVVGACLAALAGAAALFVAVKLIEAVMTALIVIVLVGLFVGLAFALLRARNRGW